MQKPDHRRTGIIRPWKLNLFQVGTKLARIGRVETPAKSHPAHQSTALLITAKKAIASSIAVRSVVSATAIMTRWRRRRKLRDCPFVTSTPLCMSALACPPKCVHAAFRLGGNHVASQFGLPCLVDPGTGGTHNILPRRRISHWFGALLAIAAAPQFHWVVPNVLCIVTLCGGP
jgi:hypothetical protein